MHCWVAAVLCHFVDLQSSLGFHSRRYSDLMVAGLVEPSRLEDSDCCSPCPGCYWSKAAQNHRYTVPVHDRGEYVQLPILFHDMAGIPRDGDGER